MLSLTFVIKIDKKNSIDVTRVTLSPFNNINAIIISGVSLVSQKQYLYLAGIDMVLVKITEISKTISIPRWYRYGFLKTYIS